MFSWFFALFGSAVKKRRGNDGEIQKRVASPDVSSGKYDVK